VTDIVGEISAASAEQSSGVSQVGQAVNQIDQATQQNAALVEEMAAAASGLKSQALDLVNAVMVFKLQGGALVALPSQSGQFGQGSPTPRRSAPAPVRLAKAATPRQLASSSKTAPKPVARTLPKAAGPKLAPPAAAAPKVAAAADDEWETF
jgi:hypothetical protein